MDSNGVSRDGPPSVHHEEDDLRIEVVGVQSPGSGNLNSHQRGVSESQNLLPDSQRNSFEHEVTKAFRYIAAPVLNEESGHFPQKEEPVENEVPQTLKRSGKELWRTLIVDLFMIGVALPFLALGVAVIYFDGKEVTEIAKTIFDNCIKVTATVFPLIFSMVIGRTLIKLASWKLERGTTLGLLEQLMGSRTFSSAIITQFRLWPTPFLGLLLIFLWLLSPAGSQASLRMLSTETVEVTSPSNISYINTRQQSYSGNGFGSFWPGFVTLFSASLVAPVEVKTSTMDLWHNVKIPYFSTLSDIPMDEDEWRSIPSDDFTPTYYSLFGLPISGLPAGNTVFTLESTYIELSCSSVTTNVTRGEDRTSSFKNPGLITTNGPFRSANNVTELTTWAIGYLGGDVTPLLPESLATQRPCLDCLPTAIKNETNYTGILLYQDFTGSTNVTSIYCSPSQAYIESRIQCNKTSTTQSCAVIAQRDSKLPHPPAKITLLSFDNVAMGLSKYLPNATNPSTFLSTLQNYIISPLSNTFIQSTPYPFLDTSSESDKKESHLLDISLKEFGDRFGQILNAFLYGTLFNSTNFLTSANFEEMNSWKNKPSFLASTEPSDLYSEIRKNSPALTITGTVTNTEEVFKCSYPWISIFVICISILPLAAILATILERRTLARDYLGFVSSLARESRYVDFTNDAVGLDGIQRGRMLRNVRVRLGDVGNVEGGHEIGTGVALKVGKIAFGGRKVARRLDRRKLYL